VAYVELLWLLWCEGCGWTQLTTAADALHLLKPERSEVLRA